MRFLTLMLVTVFLHTTTFANSLDSARFKAKDLLSGSLTDSVLWENLSLIGKGSKNTDAVTSAHTCSLMVIHRSQIPQSEPNDLGIDLIFSIDNKIEHMLHLGEYVQDSFVEYESEFDVTYNSSSPTELSLFNSIGHMTDQYIGYRGADWIFSRKESTLFFSLESSWADDDGGSGGSTYNCTFELR